VVNGNSEGLTAGRRRHPRCGTVEGEDPLDAYRKVRRRLAVRLPAGGGARRTQDLGRAAPTPELLAKVARCRPPTTTHIAPRSYAEDPEVLARRLAAAVRFGCSASTLLEAGMRSLRCYNTGPDTHRRDPGIQGAAYHVIALSIFVAPVAADWIVDSTRPWWPCRMVGAAVASCVFAGLRVVKSGVSHLQRSPLLKTTEDGRRIIPG